MGPRDFLSGKGNVEKGYGMMNRIDCEIVQDLFPSYIEGLTSDKTNTVIEEHLEGCEKCSKVLASMRGSSVENVNISPEEKQEIDFLKKNRKRNRRILFGSIAGALLLVLVVISLQVFAIGTKNDTNLVLMNLNVVDNELDFTAVPTGSGNAVASLDFTEKNGVVTVQARTVLVSPFHKGSLNGTYTASEIIKEVRIGSRIIWSDGATVSALASELFATRHDYIGDMPANNRTANALSLKSFLGAFTNELETAAEPYGWKILLSEDIHAAKLAQKEQDMDAFGRVIVGLIGNLDHVTFVYRSEGVEKSRTITAEKASAFLGEDIKNCGKSIRTLDSLVQKTGLSLYAFWDGEDSASQEEAWLRIKNLSDTEILEVGEAFYTNGQLRSSGSGINADGTPHSIGDTFWLSFSEEEFGGSWNANDLLEIAISFKTPDGKEIEISEKIRVSNATGIIYDFVLTGNEKDGYRLEQ